jgi:hypothetical protein
LALGVALSGYGAIAPATAAASAFAAHHAPNVADQRLVQDVGAVSDADQSTAPADLARTSGTRHGNGPIQNDSYLGKKPGEGKVGGAVDDPAGGTTIVYIAFSRQENPEKFSYTFYTLDAVDAWSCYPSPDTCGEIDDRFGEP